MDRNTRKFYCSNLFLSCSNKTFWTRYIIFGRQELIDKEFGGDSEQLIKSACKEAYAKEFLDKIPEKI